MATDTIWYLIHLNINMCQCYSSKPSILMYNMIQGIPNFVSIQCYPIKVYPTSNLHCTPVVVRTIKQDAAHH